MASPTIGVLSLQGDVREHLRVLTDLGVQAVSVRRPAEVASCDALVIPGGESTTMYKLARIFELFDPIRDRILEGMPTFGTCAGMIMLAQDIVDGAPDQETLGGLDITVRRNAFGRQVDSFEGDVDVKPLDSPVHAVFIRAPWVERVGVGVDVLSSVDLGPAGVHPVAVQQGPLLATSFHPEVGGDHRVHAYFVALVRAAT